MTTQKPIPRTRLSSKVGRAIDRATYLNLGLILLTIVFLSASYYYFMSPYNQGTTVKDISFLDSLYFSVVTLATVGYGDIAPVGCGRLVVVFEIMSGVMLVTLLVGKIASEKQSALLLLMYTSEQQRRLQDFITGINKLYDKVDDALTEHNHAGIYNYSKQAYKYISSISNYLLFQSNQGQLAAFGNSSSLKLLYKTILHFQEMAHEAICLTTTEQRAVDYFFETSDKARRIAHTMHPFHKKDPKMLEKLKDLSDFHKEIHADYENRKAGLSKPYHRSIITGELLEKVKNELPAKPWPKHVHKTIAIKLNIGYALSHKCISELVDTAKV